MFMKRTAYTDTPLRHFIRIEKENEEILQALIDKGNTAVNELEKVQTLKTLFAFLQTYHVWIRNRALRDIITRQINQFLFNDIPAQRESANAELNAALDQLEDEIHRLDRMMSHCGCEQCAMGTCAKCYACQF